MNPDQPIYIFPQATSTTYLVLVGLTLGLFGLAVLLEFRRRKREDRKRLDAEWRGVETVMQDKELGGDQQEQLRGLVERHSSEHPYKLVTQRSLFDDAVRDEVDRLKPKLGLDALQEQGQQLRSIRAALGLEFVPIGQSIHSTRELYLDQKLWVGLERGTAEPDWHRMFVSDVDEAFFYVAPEGEEMPRAKDGDRVLCRMWREDDGRYAFDSRIARTENQPLGWMLAHTDALKRSQSRAYFRVPIDQQTEFAVIPLPVDGEYEGIHLKQETMHLQGRLTSLSAGGFAGTVSQPVPQQMALRATVGRTASECPR